MAKKSKHRFTVTFIVNAAGKSESKPIVIWKSANPRCFKGIKKSDLPVEYFSQPKAWMTGDILEIVLCKLNKQLRSKDRYVLFMDNAGCHPPNITEKFSNIKVVFLPPNTTSVLKPLDLGIIQNFIKVHYRKLLMTFVLAKIETCSSASELLKSVNVLHAIRWVGEAWKNVKVITIKKKCSVNVECYARTSLLYNQ